MIELRTHWRRRHAPRALLITVGVGVAITLAGAGGPGTGSAAGGARDRTDASAELSGGASARTATPAPLGVPPTQQCCFLDGSCFDLLPAACNAANGFPQGPGTSCTDGCTPPSATLALEASTCQPDGDGARGAQIVVELWARDLTFKATGYQAFVSYDTATWAYEGALSSYDSAVFDTHITPINQPDDGALVLDGLVFQPGGPPFALEDTLLAVLVFTGSPSCEPVPTATLGSLGAIDSELSFAGFPIPTTLVDGPAVALDVEPPALSCPGRITASADAGACTFTLRSLPAALDGCDPAPDVSCFREDGEEIGAPFPIGTTGVTCAASDGCGNTAECEFVVTVLPVTPLELTLALPGSAPGTRCIHLEVLDCATDATAEADALVEFLSPGEASVSIGIPCGAWTHVCAKDRQHTTWATAALAATPAGFVAGGTLVLLPGDTDDDGDVDADDVAFLIDRFGTPEPSAGCPAQHVTAPDGAARGADFSNDGNQATEDFSLLSGQFLAQTACGCPAPRPSAGRERPLRRIDLHARVAQGVDVVRIDLDRNGIFDWRDVAEFERRHGLGTALSTRMREE